MPRVEAVNGEESSRPPERAARARAGGLRLHRLRWLRLPGYVVVCWAGLGIALAADEQLGRYALGAELAVLVGFAQGAAVVLALWRPMPAWALSLAGAVVAALTARPVLEGPPAAGAVLAVDQRRSPGPVPRAAAAGAPGPTPGVLLGAGGHRARRMAGGGPHRRSQLQPPPV